MLEKLHIAHLPTPVEELPRLSEFLGGPRIMVKRDDQTGLAFGGNKTRKLEYLLAEAKKGDAQTLITGGAVQSNHCRQTAAAANRYGFSCILVLTGDKPEVPAGNFLLDRFLGTEIVWAGKADREQVLKDTFETALENGRKPYLIPYGGSNARGAAAYTYALAEFLEQGHEVDWIVFASSSGGTQAGLVAGERLFNYAGRILGISIDNQAQELSSWVAQLAEETTQLLGDRQSISAGQILVNDSYLGAGYGMMGEREKEAMLLFARQEGLILDPVYTGRAAGGMIDLIRRGFFTADQKILFWHTGGSPALFAPPYWESIVGEKNQD
jgi:D-cysteine desulfhydrase family pyridoxal phosphate-dependent enzyme